MTEKRLLIEMTETQAQVTLDALLGVMGDETNPAPFIPLLKAAAAVRNALHPNETPITVIEKPKALPS